MRARWPQPRCVAAGDDRAGLHAQCRRQRADPRRRHARDLRGLARRTRAAVDARARHRLGDGGVRMLPRATLERTQREANKGKIGGRTHEIQRLIGRALRATVDMAKLGERMITIDCDVIGADGGTRTASITGAWVALALALREHFDPADAKTWPLTGQIAAVSVGIVDGTPVLDLPYVEDSRAEVDMNVAMTDAGGFVELQGTAEGKPFDRAHLDALLALADGGIRRALRSAARRAPRACLTPRCATSPTGSPRFTSPIARCCARSGRLKMLCGRESRRRQRAPRTSRRCGRYFAGFERDAQAQLKGVDRELDALYQRQYNLAAERGVARTRARGGAGRPRVARGTRSTMSVLEDLGNETTGFFRIRRRRRRCCWPKVRTFHFARCAFASRETFNQAYLLGVGSWGIVLLTSLFTGMVFSLEVGRSSRAVRRRQLGRRGGRLHDGARTRADAFRGRRRRPIGRRDLGRTGIDGRYRADRGAAVARPFAGADAGRAAARRADADAAVADGHRRHRRPDRRHVHRRRVRARQPGVVHQLGARIAADRRFAQGALEVDRLRDHHRDHRIVQRAADPRRGSRRRQVDDRSGRHRDHPDLHFQLRDVVHSVSAMTTATAAKPKLYARLEDVGVRYGPKVVMQHLSLDIVEGAITCIIGLSGAGKSTILRLLNGLERPTKGACWSATATSPAFTSAS